MHRLPEILAERPSTDKVELDLRVPADLEYFAGHFPGAPVLPGVVQLDWSIRLGRERLSFAARFRAVEQLKFVAPIEPEARVTLVLAVSRGGERLDFRYVAGETKHSSGFFIFGP